MRLKQQTTTRCLDDDSGDGRFPFNLIDNIAINLIIPSRFPTTLYACKTIYFNLTFTLFVGVPVESLNLTGASQPFSGGL